MSARRRSPTFWALLAFTLAVCAFLIVPVWMSMLAGVTQNYFTGWRGGLTLGWVIKVWTDYRHTVFLSLKVALACLACTLLLGVPAAYVLARRSSALARAIEELLVMPVAVPGLATALALIVTYGGFGDVRRSWGFILIGHVLFTLPFMVRSVLAGSLMVVTLSLGEFNMTLLLHTPLTPTLPVGLADAYASLRIEVGSAYTLIFFVIIIPLLVALQWASRPRDPNATS